MAAWVSTLGAYLALYITSQGWFVDWARDHASYLLLYENAKEIYLPSQMVIYLTIGAVLMIVVSLFTRPEGAEKLDQFYGVLRTPARAGENVEKPFTLPEGVVAAPQNKLFNHPDWEIQKPTARGIVGFLIAWVPVVLLIGMVVVLVRIGA